MKIATWNIDRLKRKKDCVAIAESIRLLNADILILTEFDLQLELPFYDYLITTAKLTSQPYNYAETERRVAIFSKFPIKKTFKTVDKDSSCCAEIETEFGGLIVYGTIVGIVGNTDINFKSDLLKQIEDINWISKQGNFCYAGDLNISFSDNYYFTHFGRSNFLNTFENNKLKNFTAQVQQNIDHIVLTASFTDSLIIKVSEWNTAKKWSDHKGTCVEIENEL